MNSSSPSQTKRHVAMLVATLMTLVYLGYRGFFTLNLAGPYAATVSLMLYGAECYGALLLFLFFFQIWDVRNPVPQPPLPGRSVDVLIPTYNEEPDLLRGTITAALKIDYPHRTYVLDDGRRAEVRALCAELGAEYITRPNNQHAKAGNLNHALQLTDGEFIVIFDADHVADRNFIDRLIGHFADPKMGFVQTPHAFYNFDAYQGILDYRRGIYWEEGMLFYNVTQPGKNRWNGVTFCGSAAMFRRQALKEVGWVATESITEDMHTGLRMHAKGWKSLFVNERLIAALAAQDITSFNTQRLRWGEGNLGIFAFDNPLTMPGLTLAQRICYLGSMLSWTTGVQKLLIYITPMLMLITGVGPVNRFDARLGILTAVYLVAVWGGFMIASNGYGHLWGIELSQMTSFWTQAKATWRAIFRRHLARFIVTAKRGRQSNSVMRNLAPQMLYIAGSTISITWALTRYWLELSHDLVALGVGSALLLIHASMAWVVIRRAMRPKDFRASWRHPAALHVRFRSQDQHGHPLVGQGVTRDINENGAWFVTFVELPENEAVELTLCGGGKSVTCHGAIRSCAVAVREAGPGKLHAQAFNYRVEFVQLTAAQLEMLWWLGAQYAVSRQYERFCGGQFGLADGERRKLPARQDEQVFELPMVLGPDERSAVTSVSETLSRQTMTALLPMSLAPATSIVFELATPFGPVRGSAQVSESQSRVIAGQRVYETRLVYGKLPGESQEVLQATLRRERSKKLAPVVRLSPARRPTGYRQPAALVAGTAAVLAVLVFGGISFVEQDEAAIARIESGHPVTPRQVDRLLSLAHRLHEKSTVDQNLLVHLRGAMSRLGRTEEVGRLDDVLARIEPETLDAEVLKAMALENLHRNREADEIFRKLIEQLDDLYDNRTRQDVLLAAARNAANSGQWPAAVERYGKLRELGTLDEAVRDEYAGVLAQAGRGDDAVKLLEEGPQTPRAMRLLASIHSSQKHFALAIEVYRKLLALVPEDQEARRKMADNALWARDFRLAVELYRELLVRTPGNLELEQQLAAALLGNRQYEAALAAYGALLESDPSRGELIDGFLSAAAGTEHLSPSEARILDSVYEHRGDFHDDHFVIHLLHALVKHGQEQPALSLIAEIEQRPSQDVGLQLQIAGMLDQFHRPLEADRIYSALLARLDELADPSARRQVLWAAARNAANRGLLALAAERFERLRAGGGLNGDAVNEYAGVLVQAGRRDEAEKLLEQSPPTPAGLHLLGSIYASQQRFDAAIDVYHRLLTIEPDDRAARRAMADNALWSRDFTTAAALYRKILDQAPDDPELTQRLAEALLGGRHYQQALALYDELLRRQGERADLEDGFLMAAAGASRMNENESRTLDLIYEHNQRRSDERFQTILLNALSKHGRERQFLPLLETLAGRAPQDPSLRLRLADALHHTGRFAEADIHYRWLLAHPTEPTGMPANGASRTP